MLFRETSGSIKSHSVRKESGDRREKENHACDEEQEEGKQYFSGEKRVKVREKG